MARVLRAPGRAVLLLTRQHARQVQQLGEETKAGMAHGISLW
jgi:hypothetical protein